MNEFWTIRSEDASLYKRRAKLNKILDNADQNEYVSVQIDKEYNVVIKQHPSLAQPTVRLGATEAYSLMLKLNKLFEEKVNESE